MGGIATPRTLRVREFDRISNVELSSNDVRFINASEAGLVVIATGRTGVYDLEATDRIGTLSSEELRVVIEPKTPIPPLLHMLGCGDVPALEEISSFGDTGEIARLMVDIYGETLSRSLKAGGPATGYVEVRDDLRSPRGRVDWFRLETRRFGLLPPVPCEFVELTVDIELNRRLAAAGRLALRHACVSSPTMDRVIRMFDGVRDQVYPTARLPRLALDRLASRFANALSLAEAILRHRSFDLGVGSTAATGFLIDMSAVFEDFITDALGRRLNRVLGSFRRSPEGLVLDEGGRFRMTPDAILESSRSKVLCVIDAKYKVTQAAKSADVYQMVAYCTGLGASSAALVYASAVDATHVVRNSGTLVHVFGVGLDRTVEGLEGRMDEVAREIIRVAQGQTQVADQLAAPA